MVNPIVVLQVLTGLGMLSHGLPKLKDMSGTIEWFKGQGYPSFIAIGTAIIEGIGSILLIIGFLPQYMATLIGLVMLGAMYHHWRQKDSFRDGWESPYLYFVACVVIVIAGVGWV